MLVAYGNRRGSMPMPHRRLAAPVLALLAPAALAGCAIKLNPESMPAPFTQAPVPSASAGQPGYVCTAVYQVLTSGTARLADYLGGHTDAARHGMQTTLADMAAKVTAAGAKSVDAKLKTAIDGISADLTAASRQPDPTSYVNGGLTTVGQKLDGLCG
jgi:hypothetical protein